MVCLLILIHTTSQDVSSSFKGVAIKSLLNAISTPPAPSLLSFHDEFQATVDQTGHFIKRGARHTRLVACN
jgi:hypothetical protein